MTHDTVQVDYPGWVHDIIEWDAVYHTDEERMRLAIAVSRENVPGRSGNSPGARAPGPVVATGVDGSVTAPRHVREGFR